MAVLREKWRGGRTPATISSAHCSHSVLMSTFVALKVLLCCTLLKTFIGIIITALQSTAIFLSFSKNNVQILNDENDDLYFHLFLF